MDDAFLTLRTFMYPTEAYPLMSRLEYEGVECFLDGENTVTAHPFLSTAIGGVRLTIKKSDLNKALKVLKQIEQENKENEPEKRKIPEAFSKGYVLVDTFCPNCESRNVYRKKFPLYKTILAIVLAPVFFPVFFMMKKHYCADCGHVWKQ